MQVAQGQGLVNKACALVLYTFNWFLHPAPTSAQDGLDPSSTTCAGGQ